MHEMLFDTARRYADAHSDTHGVARTPVRGLSLVRATSPSPIQYAVSQPLVALVLQGQKHVVMGHRTFDLAGGDSLVVTADLPTVSQITQASVRAPYLSFIVDLDVSVIEELLLELEAAPVDHRSPTEVAPTEMEVADVVLRLLRLFDHPISRHVLQDQLVRELHFWLLTGRHGAAIRNLGARDSHANRVSRAVSILRANYDRPLRVQQLADAAGMSLSSFHQHFRAITSLTPLQFQKHLRLIEARRVMLAEGAMISIAAYSVGYESVSQFTREYARLFGATPARDMKLARDKLNAAA